MVDSNERFFAGVRGLTWPTLSNQSSNTNFINGLITDAGSLDRQWRAICNWVEDTGGKKNLEQEAGSRRREAGGGRREAGGGRQYAVSKKIVFMMLLPASCLLLPASCLLLYILCKHSLLSILRPLTNSATVLHYSHKITVFYVHCTRNSL